MTKCHNSVQFEVKAQDGIRWETFDNKLVYVLVIGAELLHLQYLFGTYFFFYVYLCAFIIMVWQINDAPVLKVFNNKAGKAVNFSPVPVDPGTEAVIKVDWERRFDHMQQHSGMLSIFR